MATLRVIYAFIYLAVTAVPAFAGGASLVDAARIGDIAAVRSLLDGHVDPNGSSADGTTALHWAAERGDVELTRLLLKHGARPTVANRYGVTPLRVSCTQGNDNVVEALLQAGADPNAPREESGDTPLMIAARAGHAEIVRVLLARGARVDYVEPVRQQTALMWAAGERHPRVVKLLLDAGANRNALSSTKISPLMFAIRAGDLESVRLLLDAGVDLNAPASDGTHLLQFAIVNARLDVAKYLVERGADVTADRHGTPLQLLSFLRRADSTAVASVIARQLPEVGVDAFDLGQVLLAHGDDINARYQFAGAPPHTAFGAYNFQLKGATPFFIATVTGDVPWMRFLAAHGADPHMTNVANITPLLGAAGIGYMPGITPGTNAEVFEAVKLAAELGNDPAQVIEGGEQPDARWEGATAMHGAAIRNAPEMVAWLVDRGLAIDAKTRRGLTPYQIAAHNGAGQLYGGMLFIHSPDVADRLVKIAKERGQAIDTTSPVALTPVRR